ncbi:MAG: hypothetical protein LQ342_003379 [Letrouitia transgressa]|nr:MAG: hypothetical protein LQ342_003379 [Letrouitia transgressa]
MNAPPAAVPGPLSRSNGSGPHHVGGFGATSPPLVSPTNTQSQSPSQKRTHTLAGLESSAGSGDDVEEAVELKKRPSAPKRACNECRQQKLRCDVIQEPTYLPCSRCKRLSLDCKVDSNFKRIGKRSKHAEMEREIKNLRDQLASQQSSSPTAPPPSIKAPDTASPTISNLQSNLDHYIDSEEAVASLLDLRSGLEGGSFLRSPNGHIHPARRIESVTLQQDRVLELFRRFFRLFHPFMPLLEPEKSADHYYDASPLLFWTIISVAARHYPSDKALLTSLSGPLSRLLWATLADVPQSYIVVKALCLLCTWPLPISSTSSDPTFMLSGLLLTIAMQIGLHRPSHAQDFARFRVEFREEELKDRVKTWGAVNAVVQRVATGLGQPPSTVYDWTLEPSGADEINYHLPQEVQARLTIERFCNKVTKAFYSNRSDPVGLVDDSQRSSLTDFLARDLEDIEESLGPNLSAITTLYFRAASLHFRLSAFFDSPSSKDYNLHLFALWMATSSFLESVFELETSSGSLLPYVTNYILQMIIASGFTLLKLLNSFFAHHVDLAYGKELFKNAIRAIRTISVATNDLPSRLAEVLAQLWRGGGSGTKTEYGESSGMDSSLQLKVRCRMSMSLVYDSVWRWREEFQAKGRGNLETAVKNPTNPDTTVESSTNPNADSLLVTSGAMGGSVTPGPSNAFGESNYEVFDPLNWVLDGVIEFPYGLSDTSGMT